MVQAIVAMPPRLPHAVAVWLMAVLILVITVRAHKDAGSGAIGHVSLRVLKKLPLDELDPSDTTRGELAIHIRYGGQLAAPRPDVFNSTIVILAMHRSGSSLITGLLWLCGGTIGTRWEIRHGWLLRGDEFNRKFNEKGYFERRDVLWINRDLLQTLDFDRYKAGKIHKVLSHLYAVAATNATAGAVVLLKDPRFCLTYQWWVPMLHGRNLVSIMIVRHPRHVANSLYMRHGMHLRHGAALWELHSITALRAAAEANTTVVVVLMSRLMANLGPELKRLIDILEMLGVRGMSVVDNDMTERFYDGNLVHHLGPGTEDFMVSEAQAKLFNLLSALSLRAAVPLAEDWARVNAVVAHGGRIGRQLELSNRCRQDLSLGFGKQWWRKGSAMNLGIV